MEVTIWSKWREPRLGKATFSPDRHKASVAVVFEHPIALGWPMMGMLTRSMEFNLTTGKRIVWGQGASDDIDDWTLDEEDRKKVLDGGGG